MYRNDVKIFVLIHMLRTYRYKYKTGIMQQNATSIRLKHRKAKCQE